MQLKMRSSIAQTATGGASLTDYDAVRRAIDALVVSAGGPIGTGDATAGRGVGGAELDGLLMQWCGLSVAAFAQAIGTDYARDRLRASSSVLDGASTGSGPIHAFEVQIVTAITDEKRRRGAGLDIAYGFHASPFGEALLLMSEGGVCGLAFVEEKAGQGRGDAVGDMMRRWPRARFREAPGETAELATRIFSPCGTSPRPCVPLTLIGTPFDLLVWQALLEIPLGALVSYTQIAQHLGHPTASRAVGTANGRNPISFVVPCHRALRGDGSLGGYYWGLTRKRALIAWEAGQTQALVNH
jgi:AraC family transcriptional regulator of adaptative response/methylated-DNA-[protein]-cysteine methyltransferase